MLPTAVLRQRPQSLPGVGFAAVRGMVRKRPAIVVGVLVAHRVLERLRVDAESDDTEEDASSKAKEDGDDAATAENDDAMTTGMVAAIGFYKQFISPLLPPACRFVPTCSQYGVQAIKEFGPTKGGILTAWRLLRCSPIGGKGYDPPKWPPVPFTYSSY